MSYTKGPWNNYAGDDIYCVYDSTGKKICSIEPVDIVGWNAVHRDEAEANEALIVAAPELLEALEEVVSFWDSITMEDSVNKIHLKAREVISKAKGEVK